MTRSKKGFTLVEMLIVIAIIAILIAIAIPTFAAQLEKARVATDNSNERAAKSLAVADYLLNADVLDSATTYEYTVAIDSNGNLVSYSATVDTAASVTRTTTGYVDLMGESQKVKAIELVVAVKDGEVTGTTWGGDDLLGNSDLYTIAVVGG